MQVISRLRRRREAPARADPAAAQPGQPGPADPRALQGPARRGVARRSSALEVEDLVTAARRGRPCCSAPRWCAASPRRSRATSSSWATTAGWCGSSSRSCWAASSDDRRLVMRDYFHEDSELAPRRGARGAGRARHRRPARPQAGRRRPAPRRRLGRPRRRSAAPGLPAAVKIPRLPEAVVERDRRPLRRPAEDHAGHRSTTSTTSRAWARPGPGPSRRAWPAWPRPASSTATADRGRGAPKAEVLATAGCDGRNNGCASRCPPAPPPSWPAPTGAARGPRAGARHHGAAAAVRRPVRPAGREHGWAVCAPEPWPGREDLPSRSGSARWAPSTTRAAGRPAPRRPTCSSVEPVAVLGFCMGGMFTPEGGGHRPLRPGGRLLRDDPAALLSG